MIKWFIPAAVAASLAIPFATAAEQPIIVKSERTHTSTWAARVSQDLVAKIDYPRAVGRTEVPVGVVSVRFDCSDDGTADNIAIARGSGSSAIDRAALSAVKRLGSLRPLPSRFTANQPVRVNLVFADDAMTAERLVRRVRQDEERLARLRDPRASAELVLTVSASYAA